MICKEALKRENARMISNISTIGSRLFVWTRFSGEIGFFSVKFKEIIREYLKQYSFILTNY